MFAGEFLLGRTWQGLDPRLGQTPLAKATEGATGLAMGYDYERNVHSTKDGLIDQSLQ